ncbi:MAG: hypothetical protein V2I27_02210 [Erythrobacter sp.]|jgi:hypothetical protein|nr:hypothetical protein [Erythrobacter sp.]
MNRSGTSWQLILADLALILFLVALIALIGGQDKRAANERDPGNAGRVPAAPTQIAPAHAVYRPTPSAPAIGEWLAGQALDNRAVLTIEARHVRGEEARAWDAALALAREAKRAPVQVRVTIEEARESDLSATLAYDAAL